MLPADWATIEKDDFTGYINNAAHSLAGYILMQATNSSQNTSNNDPIWEWNNSNRVLGFGLNPSP